MYIYELEDLLFHFEFQLPATQTFLLQRGREDGQSESSWQPEIKNQIKYLPFDGNIRIISFNQFDISLNQCFLLSAHNPQVFLHPYLSF